MCADVWLHCVVAVPLLLGSLLLLTVNANADRSEAQDVCAFMVYGVIRECVNHETVVQISSSNCKYLLANNVLLWAGWVKRVGLNEYADELFLAALSACMQVQVIAVPYTPVGQPKQWRTSVYGSNEWPRVVLGNNNVHYVWLRELPR